MRALLILFVLLARPAFAYPALWAVHGPHATVYLFGSVHLTRPDTKWEGPAIQKAVAESQEYWFEIDMSAVDQASMIGTMLFTGLDFDHKLTRLLSPNAAVRLQQMFGDQTRKLDYVKPWLALSMVMTAQWSAAGYNANLGVDQVLRRQALEAKKPVKGIETGGSQVRLLASIPEAEALHALDLFLTTPANVSNDELSHLIQVWMAGDVDGVAKLMQSMMTDTSAGVNQRLLHDRNIVFADTVQRLAAGDKVVMVTVGAAHLAGEDGVPALLQQRGVTVERVN